jgi:Bacterial lectin/HYDIN/CFA65/VesB-like, Ig-like domain/Abnormal spindle-like microcephaly-assoc'd, ASPM-SPD-2-Hydin
VYYTQNGGAMLAFKYGVDGQGRPALGLAGNTSETFAFSSGSPLVTSDGVKAGTAVVWVVNVDGPSGENARLCAYNAVPVDSHLNLLRCFPIGTGVKFTMPSSSGGRVYVGTRDGRLYGFGQPVTAALNLPQTGFGNVPVGQSGSATVTATAVRTVTIDSLSTAAPFSVTAAPALPLTLTAGQSVTVGVSFAPTAPGSIAGTLKFGVTDAGVAGSLGAALQGTSTRPGFTGNPSSLDFGDVPVGSSVALSVSFTNTGTANETVSAVSSPAAGFAATGLPAVGAVVAPGQSVNVSVRFTPTAAGTATSAVSVTGAHGTGTVGLTARGVTGQAQLDISPGGLNFGTIPVGLTATETFTVSNSGNLSVTVTKAAPPALPFLVNTPLPEGQVLAPDEEVQIQVTFAPTEAGTFSGTYLISSTDGTGSHTVNITGSAVNPGGGQPLPAVGAGSWVFNGSAALVGPDVVLTTATKSQLGSAVFSSPVPSDGLRAAFTTQIGGGNGADGMTFALLDAATVSAQSLGQGGGGLGFAGLAGVAVTFDTYKNGVDPSANFIGLTTGLANGSLSYVATATTIPNLRSGTHAVVVTVTGTTVAVSIDGTQVIAATVAGLPASVRPAFTASTGGMTDRHAVSGVSITSGGTSLSSPGAGWRFNGYASMSGSSVILTPAQKLVAGSVLYSDPVPTDGLTASYSLSINGGTGADGETFVLLNPASSTSASLGSNGSGLGVAGLAGVAVAFVTYPQNGINSNNFAMIATSAAGGTALTPVAVNTTLPSLRGATRNVVVKVSGTTMTVALDGVQILTANVPALTPTAYIGYSGSTGGSTDVHAVSAAQVLVGSTGMGGGGGSIPAPPAVGWIGNGSATTNGGTIQLTPATTGQAGTAIWSTPVATAHLDATFTVTLNGGSGADGLTFMLLDPAKTTPTSLGSGGGGLGFQGLTGVAVCFITYAHTGYPSNNFVGVSAGATNASGYLGFAATSTNIPPLRTGTHTVRVSTAASGGLLIAVDGVVVLQSSVAIPATALIGFSGATGGLTDVHAVSGIGITY